MNFGANLVARGHDLERPTSPFASVASESTTLSRSFPHPISLLITLLPPFLRASKLRPQSLPDRSRKTVLPLFSLVLRVTHGPPAVTRFPHSSRTLSHQHTPCYSCPLFASPVAIFLLPTTVTTPLTCQFHSRPAVVCLSCLRPPRSLAFSSPHSPDQLPRCHMKVDFRRRLPCPASVSPPARPFPHLFVFSLPLHRV